MTYEQAANILDSETRIEELRKVSITIDDFVEYWHTHNNIKTSLKDFLGMSDQEYAEWVKGNINLANENVKNKWISVKDDMPKEHDSIFKKLKGTKKWFDGMFETISEDVNVAVKFSNGTKKTYTAHTRDGKWAGNLPEIGNPVITHWMPLPEPPEEE